MQAKNKRRNFCSTTSAREPRFILMFVKDKRAYFDPQIFLRFTNFICRVALFDLVEDRV